MKEEEEEEDVLPEERMFPHPLDLWEELRAYPGEGALTGFGGAPLADIEDGKEE